MVPTLHAPLRTSPPPSSPSSSSSLSSSFSACWHRCLPFLLLSCLLVCERVHAGDVTPVIQPGCSTWPVTKCQCPRSAPRKFLFISPSPPLFFLLFLCHASVPVCSNFSPRRIVLEWKMESFEGIRCVIIVGRILKKWNPSMVDFSKLIRIERARASCVLSCVYVTVRITGSACQGWD